MKWFFLLLLVVVFLVVVVVAEGSSSRRTVTVVAPGTRFITCNDGSVTVIAPDGHTTGTNHSSEDDDAATGSGNGSLSSSSAVGSAGGDEDGNCTVLIYDPNAPLLPCPVVPPEFVYCTVQDFSSLSKGEYASLSNDDKNAGCRNFGAQLGQLPETANATCTVLEEIECLGNHTFVLPDYPCIRYNGYYFPTALLLAIFTGWLGIDRFYMCYVCFGILKALTLGMLGIWWLADVILLCMGDLFPADGSSWEPYF